MSRDQPGGAIKRSANFRKLIRTHFEIVGPIERHEGATPGGVVVRVLSHLNAHIVDAISSETRALPGAFPESEPLVARIYAENNKTISLNQECRRGYTWPMGEPQESWRPNRDQSQFRKLWSFVGDIGNIQTLCQLVPPTVISAWRLSLMPGGWHPLQYVLSPAAWFLSTWLVATLVVSGAKKAAPRLRDFLRPPVLYMTAQGGRYAVATINCTSGTSEIKAEARIVRIIDEHNPFSHLFQCEMTYSANNSVTALRKGEWAQITLAYMEEAREPHIVLICGAAHSIALASGDVIVEVHLMGRKIDIVKQYRLSFGDKDDFHIDVNEHVN